MNNKIIELQEILFRNINRLDKETSDVKTEIARNNTLANSVTTYIKAVNLSLRIKEVANKQQKTTKNLRNELGLSYEKKQK